MTDHAEVRRDAEPSLETMRSRIYDPVLYPSMPNQFGDLRADRTGGRLSDLEGIAVRPPALRRVRVGLGRWRGRESGCARRARSGRVPVGIRKARKRGCPRVGGPQPSGGVPRLVRRARGSVAPASRT